MDSETTTSDLLKAHKHYSSTVLHMQAFATGISSLCPVQLLAVILSVEELQCHKSISGFSLFKGSWDTFHPFIVSVYVLFTCKNVAPTKLVHTVKT